MSDAQRIAVAIVERNDEVLISQRPKGVPLAGLWVFPGGKVEPGESYEAAAARECMEETGLFVSIVDEFPDVTHEYDYGVVAIRFFRCRVQGNPDLVSADDGFRWVKKSSLGDYEFPAANAEVVQALSACKRI